MLYIYINIIYIYIYPVSPKAVLDESLGKVAHNAALAENAECLWPSAYNNVMGSTSKSL